MEVDRWKHDENILKKKTFHSTKCKAYSHEILNTSKEVIRNWVLSLTTAEKITADFGKQGVTHYKRITIGKGLEEILTNTYILIFNPFKIEWKIRYSLLKVEQYIPASLRCFKCQTCVHHSVACRRCQTWGKCDRKDPNHPEEDCPNESKCQKLSTKPRRFLKIL